MFLKIFTAFIVLSISKITIPKTYYNVHSDRLFNVRVSGTSKWDNPKVKDASVTLCGGQDLTVCASKNLNNNTDFLVAVFKSSSISLESFLVQFKYDLNGQKHYLTVKIPDACKNIPIHTKLDYTIYLNTTDFMCNLNDVYIDSLAKNFQE
uniref:Uncharacterized protein n=1 Tax=Strongyloides papillosus TaxID=174720 RepID=A0A0N5CA54_STREA